MTEQTTQPTQTTPEATPAAPEAAPQAAPSEPAVVTPESTPNIERPEWLPENMKSGEELAKSYKELQAKLTETTQAKDEAPAESTSGIDFEGLSKVYHENDGVLPEENYKALEAQGFPAAVVDQYIAGAKAQEAAYNKELFSDVGGEEKGQEILTWANDNLTQEQADAFNNAEDVTAQKMILASIAAQYKQANGEDPKVVVSGDAPEPGAGEFKSWQEVEEAMNKTNESGQVLYQTDPAYNAAVVQKIQNSSALK